MVTIDELLQCAFEQGYGKLRKGSKTYKILLDIEQKEANKSLKRILRKEKEKCLVKIICEYCDRNIMYKNDCVSYYDPSTKTRKFYHFNCQFRS